jgi:large conductance mechanosensitive channel
MRDVMQGFKAFILRGNIVDLAVAVVVGTAFTAVVNALVKDLFTPLIAALGGKQDFSKLTFTVNHSTFMYGDFINYVISFLTVGAVIYFLVVMPLARLHARRLRGQVAIEEDPVISEEAKLLIEIRDLLAARETGGGNRPYYQA